MVSEGLAFELRQLIRTIRFYNQLLQETDQRIQSMMKRIQSPISSIPGISHHLGSVVIAEVQSIHHFQNPGQLLAFSGLEPSIYQSGEFFCQGKMVKRDSPALR